jgi:predicted RNA-binding Zn-ribbon protein involved in translation (DUF1610 family)
MTVMTKPERHALARKETEIPCPRCGERLNEIMRADESKAKYVWYQCPGNDCAYTLLVEYA